ncbi:MAG TPA: cation:proton antiporter, partial [Micrococcaceae bacterium]
MTVVLPALAVVVTVLIVTGFATRFRLPAPLLLTVVGVGASFLPFVPDIHLDPELVLVGILPPLLYAAAIRSSLIDFRDNRVAIGFLSVGLVIVTALGVGLVAWWLLPIPFAAAFALGAVVAPPDAVAATAIGRRIGLPRRLVTLLEGESLLNDATALVCLSTAAAAITGTVTVWGVGGSFLLSAAGGLAVGIVVAFVINWVHRRFTDAVTNTALSLITPFLAFLPAQAIHGSGVLAVVVAGLLIAHSAPRVQTAASRLGERTNWSAIQFLLENGVFLIIGLQMRTILGAVSSSQLPWATTLVAAGGVLLAVIVLRPLWVFPARFLMRQTALAVAGAVSGTGSVFGSG